MTPQEIKDAEAAEKKHLSSLDNNSLIAIYSKVFSEANDMKCYVFYNRGLFYINWDQKPMGVETCNKEKLIDCIINLRKRT